MQNTLQKNIRFNNFRFIPRFEIKGNYLIKGMKMEGLKKIDNIFTRIEKTLSDGADEIIIDDIVASLYSRKFDINPKNCGISSLICFLLKTYLFCIRYKV